MTKIYKRIVIGILSAAHHRERRENCRATWLADLAGNAEVEYIFVVGGGDSEKPKRDGDILYVGCPDTYEHLPQKTRALIEWASEHFQFDCLFKCDDDTYVSAPRLLCFDLLGREYVGEYCSGYAQGGAGYFLSRRAAETAAIGLREYESGAEDHLVGQILKANGIALSFDDRFRSTCEPRHWPQAGNSIVTCHECRAQEMIEIHRHAPEIAAQVDPGYALFSVREWVTGGGGIGLTSDMRYPIKARHLAGPANPIASTSNPRGPRFISAHTNSEVRIEASGGPISVFGFLGGESGDVTPSPVQFLVDGSLLGEIQGKGDFTPTATLSRGSHVLSAICLNPENRQPRHSVWSVGTVLRPSPSSPPRRLMPHAARRRMPRMSLKS